MRKIALGCVVVVAMILAAAPAFATGAIKQTDFVSENGEPLDITKATHAVVTPNYGPAPSDSACYKDLGFTYLQYMSIQFENGGAWTGWVCTNMVYSTGRKVLSVTGVLNEVFYAFVLGNCAC